MQAIYPLRERILKIKRMVHQEHGANDKPLTHRKRYMDIKQHGSRQHRHWTAPPCLMLIFAFLFSLCLLDQEPASASPPDRTSLKLEIKEWRLANGLRVIHAPHRQVPAVTVQVWYHVGSKNEHPGNRGMAHLFEHMMFKGSLHVPPEAHARMISALGGTSNAFTSEDVTAYHNTVPHQYLEFALKLEAERMQNLLLTPRTIQSEREVVKEEKRMRLDNNPIGRAIEAIQALTYTKHPYQWTPAGNIADLDQVTQKDCENFYRTYYAPNNATLLVVGDVSESEVRQAVARQFSSIPPRRPDPPAVTIIEPPQTALRHKKGDWPSQLKVMLGAYHIPAASQADLPALRVLVTLLASGKSSRLNQALVRKKALAVEAGGAIQLQEDPGLLLIYAIGLPTHDLTKIKEALLQEVDQLAQEEPSTDELTKAKNQLATAHLQRLETMEGLAYQIGDSTLIRHDPRAFLTDVNLLDQVTAQDIKRVAKRYIQRTNLSLVVLDPPK